MDTNVPIVANRRQGESLACANACTQALLDIRKSGLLLLDEAGGILEEYRRYLSWHGQPGVGDAFMKWAHDNVGRQDLIRRVTITPKHTGTEQFVEFPDTPELARFDPSDRKFVAVALSHGGNPPILNATDSDWWDYRDALEQAGVTVRFLCPELFSECTG